MHRFLLCLCCILTVISIRSFAKENYQIYGQLPFVDQVQISPDGSKISYLQEIDNNYFIIIRELFNNKKKPVVFGLGSGKIRWLEWANNSHILFTATLPYYSKGDYETFTIRRMGILDIETNEAEWPFNKGTNKYFVGSPYLINKLINDEDHILVGFNGEILKVELSSADKETYFDARDSSSWLTELNGEVSLFNQYDRKTEEHYWRYKTANNSEFFPIKIQNEENLEYFKEDIEFFDQNSGLIYYTTLNEKKMTVLMEGKIVDGQVVDTKVLSSHSNYDISGISTNYTTNIFDGVSHIADYQQTEYYNKTLASVHADLIATFPDQEVKITSYSKDYNRFIVFINDATTPGAFYFYDKAAVQLSVIAEQYPDIKNLATTSVKKMTYKASDGVEIEAYFSTPTNTDNKPFPLIVIPHGGPASRDDLSFDWLRSFFVSEGFAVFQPNFRGSKGYGEKFLESGYKQWGKAMQGDVDDGVNMLINSSQVDKSKICVVGASYGGYVAQFSATSRQSMYKCAVSFAGISDLDDMYYHALEQKGSISYWEKSIGKRDDVNNINQYSPIHLISDSILPLLLMHGKKDTVVPLFQSTKMFKALKKAKVKNFKYIELDSGDHWFSESENRKRFLKESLEFVQKHI